MSRRPATAALLVVTTALVLTACGTANRPADELLDVRDEPTTSAPLVTPSAPPPAAPSTRAATITPTVPPAVARDGALADDPTEPPPPTEPGDDVPTTEPPRRAPEAWTDVPADRTVTPTPTDAPAPTGEPGEPGDPTEPS